jgi:hypothetical protein
MTALVLAAVTAGVHADETLDRLMRDYEQAQQNWYKQMRKMYEEGSDKAFDMTETPEAPFIPKFKAYAEEHAGTPEAIPALGWLLSHSSPIDPAPVEWAVDQLKANHAADPAMSQMVETLAEAGMSAGRERIVELCEAILEANEDRQVRAGVTFALARTLYTDEMFMGPGQDAKRAEKLFRQIVADYKDSPFAEQAGPYIFELDHLQIGMKAPEVAGTSPDGEPVMLSQFAGQVVVLDFWGFW